MKTSRFVLPLALLLGLTGCDTEDPTQIVVDNDYPAVPEGGDVTTATTVYKVWWVTSLLDDPVAPGGEGAEQRTVPSTDFAYLLLAPGWDPSSATPPTKLIPARSAGPLTVGRGETLHVHASDRTLVGNCAAGKPLSQDDADTVTQRIFPGDFAGSAYTAATCVRGAPDADAGVGDTHGD